MFLFESNLTKETVSVGFEHCQFDDVPVFVMIFRYSSELQLWTSHIYEPRDLSQEIHHFSYQKPFTIISNIIIQPLAVPPRWATRTSCCRFGGTAPAIPLPKIPCYATWIAPAPHWRRHHGRRKRRATKFGIPNYSMNNDHLDWEKWNVIQSLMKYRRWDLKPLSFWRTL